MMTKRDPHGNIVRGTIAALAAAVGGADAVTVLPFSAALGVPDAFARRIARNTQTILIEEANIHRVADPAAGSGAIEALTDALCADGLELCSRRSSARAALPKRLRSRIDPTRGRARFAPSARPMSRAARTRWSAPATSPISPRTRSPCLAQPRLAARVDATNGAARRSGSPSRSSACATAATPISRKHGARPKVFLACLGRAADFNARASFAKSLFEAGGIEAVEGNGDNLAKRFKESGAKLACLCSSDKVYEREAEDAAKALAEAGATRIYLAGKPGANKAALEQAGISSFLHQGCDTLADSERRL